MRFSTSLVLTLASTASAVSTATRPAAQAGVCQKALQRKRGLSISFEYAQDDEALSEVELSMLSLGLRKQAEAASLSGSFPGPKHASELWYTAVQKLHASRPSPPYLHVLHLPETDARRARCVVLTKGCNESAEMAMKAPIEKGEGDARLQSVSWV